MSQRAASDSYHPHGFDSSASLLRARRPYYYRNLATGTAIVAFILGVYGYSIAAVKQDDFSDVADLLPPAAERAAVRTIEDELRDAALSAGGQAVGAAPYHTSSPSAPSKALPATSSTPALPAAGLQPAGPGARGGRGWGWGWTRLNELEGARRRGLVDEQGNALVWGAPSVDRVGGLWDGAAASSRGPRLV